MVTKEEWDEIDRRVAAWEKWQLEKALEKAAERAKDAAQHITADARVDPELMRKPTTI